MGAIKTGLLVSAAAVGIAVGGGVSGMAQAQEGFAIEEILVTSTRRTTSLQTTAAAVSAFSSDDLSVRSVNDIQDLSVLSPSTNVSFYQGEAQVYIRGIGYSGIIGGTDSSTALHIDGVYMSRSSAAVPGFFDVDRVEIVRGPQGTLYGRNATSGSVNIITKKPTEEFSAEGSVTIGNYDRYKVFGAVSGPLSDSVRARVAVQREDRSGYTTVIRPQSDPSATPVTDDIEDKSDITARATIEMDASEDVRITLTGDYYEADDAGVVWHFINAGTGSNPFMRNLLESGGHYLPEEKSRTMGSDVNHINKLRVWGLTGKLEWALGDYSLTSLTAYKETRPLNKDDLDTTSGFGVDQLREEDHSQFSQEFQISSPQGEKLEWILGAYYFTEDNAVRNEYFLPFVDEAFGLPSDDGCCLLKLNGESETEALAGFGEATYDITDRLEVVLGARYSWEKRDGANLVVFENFIPGLLDNVAPFTDKNGNPGGDSFSAFTPKFGLNFTVNDDVFTYATVSKGFKSGGFNTGSYQNTPFDPEKIWAYEVGVKADLFDQRLRVNAAAFYYDYKDLQIQDTEGNNTVVRNAAKAKIKGVEIESTALLTEELTLDLNATWLHARFSGGCLSNPKFLTYDSGGTNGCPTNPLTPATPNNLQNLDGNHLFRAPDWTIAVGLQYTTDLANGGSLTFRGDYKWQDKTYLTNFNNPAIANPSAEQGSYDWARARVSYTNPTGNWQIAAFIDNITDEVVATNATFNGDIIDSTLTGSLAPPRTYGVEFKYTY